MNRRLLAVGGAGAIDQIVFSAGNMLFFLAVARQSDDEAFGLVATGMLLYESVQLALRGTFAQPASLIIPKAEPAEARRLASGQLAFTLALAIGTALLVAAVELVVFSGERRTLLVSVALLFLPILFTEGVRSAAFALLRPAVALIVDSVWTGVQLVAFVVLFVSGQATTVALIAAWGVGAAVGAIAGLVILRVAPVPSALGGWLRAIRPISGRLTIENVLSAFQTHTISWVVLLVVGSVGVGAVRGVRTMFGPATALGAGLRQALVPYFRRRIDSDRAGVDRGAKLLGLTIASIAVVTAIAFWLLPASIGEQLLGDTFAASQDLALIFGAFVVTSGAVISRQVLLLAGGNLTEIVRSRIALAVLILLLVPVGVVVGDQFGAIAAAALATLVSLPIWFRAAARVGAGTGTGTGTGETDDTTGTADPSGTAETPGATGDAGPPTGLAFDVHATQRIAVVPPAAPSAPARQPTPQDPVWLTPVDSSWPPPRVRASRTNHEPNPPSNPPGASQ